MIDTGDGADRAFGNKGGDLLLDWAERTSSRAGTARTTSAAAPTPTGSPVKAMQTSLPRATASGTWSGAATATTTERGSTARIACARWSA